MNDLIKYIKNTLGVGTTIAPLEKQLLRRLPLNITAIYEIKQTTICGHRVCLLIAKNLEETPTPAQLAKQMFFITQNIRLPVVYVFDKITSYNIKRLIQKSINFIIPGKQLFIPALMMNLCKAPDRFPRKSCLLTPLAQFLLMYHLQRQLLNGLTTQQLTDKFTHPYRSMSRAVNNLKELGLCNLVGQKEKCVQFAKKGKKLWIQAQDFLQNPVEYNLFTDKTLNKKHTRLSNINALAHFTMINDEEKRFYAIGKREVKKITVETNKYAGDNTIEVWRYNPYLLSDNEFVDKLSLYFLLKNNSDARIQRELEQMINQIQWLEE